MVTASRVLLGRLREGGRLFLVRERSREERGWLADAEEADLAVDPEVVYDLFRHGDLRMSDSILSPNAQIYEFTL